MCLMAILSIKRNNYYQKDQSQNAQEMHLSIHITSANQ